MNEEHDESTVIPVIEEELVTGAREVKTGTVRVSKEVEQVRKIVSAPAVRDVVQVNRIPVNRIVDSIPQMREEGDLLVIPVVEEELVIQKRLVLKEEIHIRRRRTRERVSKEVTLDSERAVVERLDAEGNVIARSAPAQKGPAPRANAQPRRSHRSLVD
ncbi:MAG TPA: YsnF/AvaK domain-containing protein [Bryobacteraceae bacterium]|nr:YsnF/AvaK domain-containing protein [Bryobacteraceae bacterium]